MWVMLSRLPLSWPRQHCRCIHDRWYTVEGKSVVESERHKGTCHKAAIWINLGGTSGRGKKSVSGTALDTIKDIWLSQLPKNLTAFLRR